MKDLFDTLLPILTLLLGSWLTWWVSRSDTRSAMRLEAADLLAELPGAMWDREDGAWLRLNTAAERLRTRLCLAGVHPDLASLLAKSAQHFWRSAELHMTDDGEEWIVMRADSEDWNNFSGWVAHWLLTGSRFNRWRMMRTWDSDLDMLR